MDKLHEMPEGHMRTRTGGYLNILNPDPDNINIEDIATGLAYNSHFAGQIPRYFSIAEHCLLTAELAHTDYKFPALMHDASEGYLGDMISPMKKLIPEFRTIEQNLLEVTFKKFGIPFELVAAVKHWDLQAQQIEYEAFYQNRPDQRIRYLSPEQAKREFIRKFEEHACFHSISKVDF